MPKIVILDAHTTNPGDLSWKPISQLGDLKIYDRTSGNQIYQRARYAEVLIVNKVPLDQYYIGRLRKLKLICTLATGYNNIDVDAAAHFGVTVCNAVGYSTPSVAQHVFSLLLEMTNRVGLHSTDVRAGGWTKAPDWCYWKSPMTELAGKTMGIYGFGKIGQQVAQIALAFGMKVIANRKNMNQQPLPQIEYVSLERLFSESDVLSLHAPLTEENRGIVNAARLSKMKPSALLINTGRGGLVNELDLKNALLNGTIAGAGLDVLSQEPPPAGHPLTGLPNCLVTPHHAWATRESRQRLIGIVAENIKAFLAGRPKNVVN
ncbi:MAG TPA: D-2-hydroxyacid dehydrogenase [Bacteroidetes bacterium]|nr:D-2-hydroxyacid dehydrogenase [Bacteroidota bacterium]